MGSSSSKTIDQARAPPRRAGKRKAATAIVPGSAVLSVEFSSVPPAGSFGKVPAEPTSIACANDAILFTKRSARSGTDDNQKRPPNKKRKRAKYCFDVEQITCKETLTVEKITQYEDETNDESDARHSSPRGSLESNLKRDEDYFEPQQKQKRGTATSLPSTSVVQCTWKVYTQPLATAFYQTMKHRMHQLLNGKKDLPRAGSGCLLHFNLPSGSAIPDGRFWSSDTIKRQIQSNLDLGQIVQDFLKHPLDSNQEIASAMQAMDNLRSIDGMNGEESHNDYYGLMEDWLFWQNRKGSLPLKDFTKLRRMLLPLTLLVTSSDHQELVNLQRLSWSLADIIVSGSKANQVAFLSSLLRTLQAMKQVNYTNTSTMDDLFQYNEVQDLILSTCRRKGGKIRFDGNQINLKGLALMNGTIQTEIEKSTRRSYSEYRVAELLEIEEKRNRLLSEHEMERGRKSKSRQVDVKRATFTMVDMPEEEFLNETSMEHRVNQTLPRRFDPLESRPRFARAPLTDSELAQIQQTLFDTEGRLKKCCYRDASRSTKNQYISFENCSGAGSNDSRWQIPIKDHVVEKVRTRSKVENILIKAGVVNPEKECIKELAIIIGGTEDQSLHHDMPRDFTTWQASQDHESATMGWEVNRLQYNVAMQSRYAPASMLLPMTPCSEGDSSSLLVGVQKDQVVKIQPAVSDSKRVFCRIRHGDPCEDFEIVRESKYVVVLKVKKGCIFTGDFPHLGVLNLQSSQHEQHEALSHFFSQVDQISRLTHVTVSGKQWKHQGRNREPDHVACSNAVLELCCGMVGLNKLSRLFISTESKEHTLSLPDNAVGYCKCYSNPSESKPVWTPNV
mmetsp:Transcript_10136/g.20942  ORF Transcript_10136/g.20942 Transcript_10136/m.20942 type:complete len:844 (-) Transcript_10136:132-2663(-)